MKYGIVLLNLGGPDSLDAVEPFLYNLFCDPEIINFPLSFLFRKRLAKLISSKRAPKIQEQYKKIGGKSPILELTNHQAELLETELKKSIECKVYIAMRYWHPFTSEVLERIEKDKIDKALLLPLYPQFSKSTTGSSIIEWNNLLKARPSLKDLKVEIIESYYDNDLYIKSVLERINQGLDRFPENKRSDVYILFSAHGTPVKLVKEGDPYSIHIQKTVDAVLKAGQFVQKSSLAFQSKVGPQKWLTPSTPDVIEDLASKGIKDILIVPIAFVSDHLETLFELGIEYRHLAMDKGFEQYEVTEGLNDSKTFISALAKLSLNILLND
jgi:protoporphyrin/coproporphyrin ferrochelatase